MVLGSMMGLVGDGPVVAVGRARGGPAPRWEGRVVGEDASVVGDRVFDVVDVGFGACLETWRRV